jgi:Ni/Co efflux regulator RcnB|tara:strand:+ start:19150 stop:19494 length:345 start_codon:yes stop_codon:yes gene_type:complete
MKKLISSILILSFTLPLMAQEKEEVKEESTGAIVVRHLQDAEWRKFDAAHKRAHSKRGEQHPADKRKKMAERQKIRQLVRLVIVGSVAYYVGYHEGEKHFKPGGWMKRPGRGDK